jgi:uncharacterized protein YyaL (SSP411 family)
MVSEYIRDPFRNRIFLFLSLAALGGSLAACMKNETTNNESTKNNRQDWQVPESLPGAPNFPPATRAALERALAAQPEGYEPRTHHFRADGGPKYTNRLMEASSPYLLQHAHNPVSWYPWGEEAFAEARAANRPVFLSVGYSTCHWCHVMEGESFEDEEIARILNERFVSIKVDREERPDIDAVHMDAIQMLTGRGGWPMTVVLTPEGEPFFGGTYFPARQGDRGNRAGLREILLALAEKYESSPEEVIRHARKITADLQAQAASHPPAEVPTTAALQRTAQQLHEQHDPEWGGFGRAPKFPRSSAIELLLRHYRRTGDTDSLAAATRTLDKMAHGGIRDHVGGGFHRYSVDTRWLVPHFEKMLYDNALLAQTYLEAYQVTQEPLYREVALEILEYVGREMTHVDGGFFSATDADSEVPGGHQEEGYFFTWTPEELQELLSPEEVRIVELHYGVRAEGNFEGRNIFHTSLGVDRVATLVGRTPEEVRRTLEKARKILYAHRQTRPAPLLDDKILAGWNGLMISAFARGGRILQDPDLTARAEAAAGFVLDNLAVGNRLGRSWRNGKVGGVAVLDDYAFLIFGLLDLFETTGEARWLRAAIDLQDAQDSQFLDAAGGYYYTAAESERLLTRTKPSYDGARPAANSVALQNLLRLATLRDDDRYREQAERALTSFSMVLDRAGLGSPRMLAALDFRLDTPREILLIKPDPEASTAAFDAIAATSFQPNAVVVHATEGDHLDQLAEVIPLLRGKVARSGKVTAYVCENRVCELPTTSAEVFREQLAKVRPYP